MAGNTDVKSLLLEVDASVELLRRNLTRGEQAVGAFETEARQRLDRLDKRFERLGDGLRPFPAAIARARSEIATIGATTSRVEQQVRASSAGIRSALQASAGAIGAALSVNQIKEYADGYTRYTNQLKVAGLEGGALAKTQNELFDIAQRYGVQLESVGTLYGRASQAGKALGASQSDLIRFTNGVAAGLKVQGGSAESAQGALLQLSQLLATGTVRAEEFNSVNEGALPILQAVASGLDKYKGSVAALRNDVIAGNVTSQDFFRGFLKGSADLEAKAAKANLTIGASFVTLNNALGKYIGETDASLSATERVSSAIVALSRNLDTIVPALTIIGVGFGTKFAIGPITASVLAVQGLKAELMASNVVMLGGKTAAAMKTQAAVAGAQAEVAAIEATIAARRADQASLAQSLALIEAQRAAALQAQQAIAVNVAAGFGTVGVTRSLPDAARANQDLKAQIVTKRALAAVDAELVAAETALAAAQQRAAAATVAASVAATEATLASRAAAAASRLLAGALTLIGGSVAGGAAVLAIGALVASVMYFRSEAAKTAEQLASFAQHEKEAAETSKLLASYALSAGSSISTVGGQAATATSKVVAFAGAVGEAAAKLEDLARARQRELTTKFAADKLNADNDAAAARERYDSLANRMSRADPDVAAQIAARKQYESARERSRNAQAGLDAANKMPLTNYIRETDRPGGRDAKGELERVRRDLVIAAQAGNKAQIADLKAQQFELTQYAKYRKDGLSVEASNTQAARDAADFRKASGEKEARVAGAKSVRDTAAAARKQAIAVRDAAADDRAFAAAERQANNDIASAKAELSNSAEERAKIEKERIESERLNRNQELADQLKQGRFGDGATGKARLKKLQDLNDERAGLETQVVVQRERQRVAAEELSIAQAGRENQRDLLQAQSSIATTASERRRLELAILEIQYKEEEARLRAVTVANGATAAEQEIAEARLALLPQLKASAQTSVKLQTQDPLQAYGQKLADKTGDMNEALKGVKANGLQELEDGLVGVVNGTESVAGAFKRMAASIIADLARIAIQKAIVGALGKGFFGLLADGGKVSSVSTANLGAAQDGGLVAAVLGGMPGYAGGGVPFVDQGKIRGAGDGRSDSILAMVRGRGFIRVSNGEGIVNERGVRDHWPLIDAINKGKLPKFATGGMIGSSMIPSRPAVPRVGAGRAGDGAPITFDMRGAVVTEDLLQQMERLAADTSVIVVRGAAPGIIDAARSATIASASRPRL